MQSKGNDKKPEIKTACDLVNHRPYVETISIFYAVGAVNFLSAIRAFFPVKSLK